MTTQQLALLRPSLLGRHVFDDAFNSFFNDFPTHLLERIARAIHDTAQRATTA